MTQQRITNLSAEEMEAFFLLLPRIFCDYRDMRRGPYKMAFVYSNTPDNESSSFFKVIEMVNAGEVESLGMSEGDRGHGYEGFDYSVERLKVLGLKNVVPIVKFDENGIVTTGTEAQKLSEYALSIAGSGHDGDIAIIAPPFHIVRVFMTTVTALKRNNVSARVYAVPGVPLPWNEQVHHSQGIVRDTRARLLIGELERLEKYRAPEFGSMLLAKEVIEYLNWRDG